MVCIDNFCGRFHRAIFRGALNFLELYYHKTGSQDEEVVYGDAGYQRIEKRPEMAGKTAEFRTAMRPGKRRQLSNTPADRLIESCERAKAHIRAKVEHPFRVNQAAVGFSENEVLWH